MYYVYVLLSKKDYQLYIGYSPDLRQRLTKHHNGHVPATQNRLPLELIYYEAHMLRDSAVRREKYFKTSKGKAALKHILGKTLSQLHL